MMFSFILLEHMEWLLGLAAAAFGAILMRRRHKSIRFGKVSKQVQPEDSTPEEIKACALDSYSFLDDLKKSRVFDAWEEHESGVKGGEWDRREATGGEPEPADDLRSEFLGQSTPADERARKNHLDEWDTGFDSRSESWIQVAKSVPAEIVSKGPQYLAKAKDEVVKLWETSSRKLLTSWSLPEFVSAVDVDENWGEVAAGSSDGYLSLWDIASSECVRTWKQFNSSGVRVVKMSPQYRSLISAGFREEDMKPVVEVWDRRELTKPVQKLVLPGTLSSPGMGPGMRIGTVEEKLYVTEQGCVRQYDLRKLTRMLREDEGGEALAESWTLSDGVEGDEAAWDVVEQDECWEDGDDGAQLAKSHQGMLATVTGFLTSFIHS